MREKTLLDSFKNFTKLNDHEQSTITGGSSRGLTEYEKATEYDTEDGGCDADVTTDYKSDPDNDTIPVAVLTFKK